MRKGPVEVKRSGLDGEVLAGKTIHLKDATADGRFQYPESAKAEGLVSVLSAPLMADGKAIGLIRVYSDVERDFTPTSRLLWKPWPPFRPWPLKTRACTRPCAIITS